MQIDMIMQYIYASRNALLDGSPMIVAQMNVCAMQAARVKDRVLSEFTALCAQDCEKN
ncbi:hypothetical protein [Nitrosomonas mobilis]|nr:hypothetical protein [Nitrosomonas mobilis]